jgi:DNA-binding protein H-NS
MELSKLSVTELKKLKTRVDNELNKRDDSTRKALLKKIQKLTAEAGMTISDVLGNKPAAAAKAPRASTAKKTGRGVKGKVAPKYRDPANPANLWTGRGRKPQWVLDQLNSGKTLADLAI